MLILEGLYDLIALSTEDSIVLCYNPLQSQANSWISAVYLGMCIQCWMHYACFRSLKNCIALQTT